jgi:hypothetical protein
VDAAVADGAAGTDAVPPDAPSDPLPDADQPPAPRDVVHVPENGWFGGDTTVYWEADVTIDTTALTLTGPGLVGGTPGIVFDAQAQEPSGPELAVLHLGDWTVTATATVRVVGNRPLVVISSGDIRLQGRIDAGARDLSPGPGGAGPGQGDGAGGNGGHIGLQDSGGGGAGHGNNGARGSIGCIDGCGGPDEPAGGVAGTTSGDATVTVLTGGSGGGAGGTAGAPSGCAQSPGGAGGGAVQLYAVGTITMDSGGGILAGGGGGVGGRASGGCDSTAGGGGGAGGVIYLQAARIELAGTLAANGGGGGGGALNFVSGEFGDNGDLSATPAAGGSGFGVSGAGGDGGAGNFAPEQGEDYGENGGGGGGGVGYIVLHCDEFTGGGVLSPAAYRTAGCIP